MCFAVSTFSLNAGGWPQPKGKFYLKLSYNTLNAKSIFDADGDVFDLNYDAKWSGIGLYGEYGLFNNFTVIADIPFNNKLKLGDNNELSSLGDVNIGLKYGISGVNGASISLYQQIGTGTQELQDNNIVLATGDGQYAQVVKFDYGSGFKLGSKDAYYNLYAGYRDRKNGFNDEIKAGLEIGSRVFTNKLLFILRSDMVFPSGNLDVDGGFDPGNYFGNNISYISFSPEINYFISDNIIVNAGLGGAILAKNIYAAPSISFGIAYKN
jgi:hypothetical protein